MNFIIGLNRGNRYLSSFIFSVFIIVLKFDDLLGGWKLAANLKLQLNISKIMPDRTKKDRETRGVNNPIKDTCTSKY